MYTTDELIQGKKFALLLAEIFLPSNRDSPFSFLIFLQSFPPEVNAQNPCSLNYILRRVLGNMEFATPTLFYFSKFIKVDLHIFAYKTSFQTHSLSDFLQKPLLKVVRSRLRTRALWELGSCGFILHHAYGIRTRDILISCETLLFFLKQ